MSKLFLKITLLIITLSVTKSNYSQDLAPEEEEEKPSIFKPTVGIGSGMFIYKGDIARKQKLNSPVIGKIGWEFRVTQDITDYLDASFFFIQGKVGANERSSLRNVNFQSSLSVAGLQLQYNFHHLLPSSRVVEPFLGLGIESFEFLSKTDAYDQFGNKYHYWNDGSIRNIDQDATNSGEAIILQRDYTYETDIRAANLDGFGKYKEKSIAIPLSFGVNFKVSQKISLKVGTSYRFTMTDMIDGISDKSVGNRAGDAKKDNLMYSYVNLGYNFGFNFKEDPFFLHDDDLLAGDDDGDGVPNIIDKCPDTPLEALVYENGCPQDKDGDGVPDYRDLELESPDSTLVDANGVSVTDDMFEKWYQQRNDTTGEFAVYEDTITKTHNSDPSLGGSGGQNLADQYFVRIGDITGNISKEKADSLLSMPGVQTWEENGKRYLVVGPHKDMTEAQKAMVNLTYKGFSGSDLVQKDNKGNVKSVKPQKGFYYEPTELDDPQGQTVYRIQVGAFRDAPKEDLFRKVPQLAVVQTNDGITRYYSGTYDNYQSAANAKADLLVMGFKDAFVVPFNSGKKITLAETGSATPTASSFKANNPQAINYDKKDVRFSVQIGAYKAEVPANLLEIFMQLNDVEQQQTEEGLTRYMSGNFDTYDEAKSHKEKLESKGVKGAFVIGKFKTKVLTAQEAIELKNR